MFVEERRRVILDKLRAQGRVLVKDLSDLMQVSAVTIRQDLRALEEEGLLERTYGGAVQRHESDMMPELSFHVRQNKKRREKALIAQAAAAMVKEGDSVALDASSTVHALIAHLKAFRKLMVVTNSLIIAQSFLDSPQIQVILPGGRLRRDSISIVGAPEGLPDINFNIGFFSARGISVMGGVSDVDFDEVTVKQAMAGRCVRTVVLVDDSKWGQVAPYTFLRLDQVGRVITNASAPADLVAEVRAKGVDIQQVK